MPKFLTGQELNSAIEQIIKEASNELIIISPYIKLHHHYVRVLKAQSENVNLKLTVVFGKNDDDKSKSIKAGDLEIFKEFADVEIRYERSLHAKYYANERGAILTSMNLYDYSQNNNVEAGIYLESDSISRALIDSLITNKDSLHYQSLKWSEEVIKYSKIIYKKVAEFKSGILNKTFLKSSIEQDETSVFFSKEFKGYPVSKSDKINSEKPTLTKTGFCIRSGIPIPFNVEKPMCYDAYKEWVKNADKNEVEKFCHFSGEPSNGETSYLKPVLKKNWNKAKEQFKSEAK